MKVLDRLKSLWKTEERYVLAGRGRWPWCDEDPSSCRSIFIKQPEQYRTIVLDHCPMYLYFPNILFEVSLNRISKNCFMFNYLSVFFENDQHIFSVPLPNTGRTVCLGYSHRNTEKDPCLLVDRVISHFWTSKFTTTYDFFISSLLGHWETLSKTELFRSNGFEKLREAINSFNMHPLSNENQIKLLSPYPTYERIEIKKLLKKWDVHVHIW